MSRKPSNFARRFAGGGGIRGLFHPKSRFSPLISIVLVFLITTGLILVIGYVFQGSGLSGSSKQSLMGIDGYPGHSRAKVAELSKFGRPAKMRSSTWWAQFFVQTSFEENEDAIKKFEQAAAKSRYIPSCHVFHLKSQQ